MRYVIKDLNDIPPILISARALSDIERIANGETNLISPAIYKAEYKDINGKLQSTVREHLNRYYLNKCAYCETHCKAEIEHYRPKLGITGEPLHGGYYWLCYSWSNLVPSCRYCNTEGGKGNHFPIIQVGNRVTGPDFVFNTLDTTRCIASMDPLIYEEPYLLHPEIDNNPEDFLGFKISDDKKGIDIIGLKIRGEKTIEICNLNRIYLRFNRLESVFYNIKQKITIIFDLNARNIIPNDKVGESLIIIFKQIEDESQDESLQHTLLRKFVIRSAENFINYFSPYLDSQEQIDIAIQAFSNYKEN